MKRKNYIIPSSKVDLFSLNIDVCLSTSPGSNPPTKPEGGGGQWEAPRRMV